VTAALELAQKSTDATANTHKRPNITDGPQRTILPTQYTLYASTINTHQVSKGKFTFAHGVSVSDGRSWPKAAI
jgi:hypothetical protein